MAYPCMWVIGGFMGRTPIRAKLALNDKVSFVFANIDAVMEDLAALLLGHLGLRFSKLVGKGILVDLFQKTRA